LEVEAHFQTEDKFPEKFVRIWKSDRIYIYNEKLPEKFFSSGIIEIPLQ